MENINVKSKIDKLTTREKILLSIVGVLAVGLLYFYFIIAPALDKLNPLKAEVAVLKEKNADYENLDSRISSRQKQLDALVVTYSEAVKILPRMDRYPELSKKIDELADKNAVTIENINMGKGKPYSTASEANTPNAQSKAGLNTVAVSLVAKGSFTNVLKLINDLEQGDRLCEVDSVAAKEDSTKVDLTFYYASGDEKENYDFNNSSYGKDNMFN